MIKQKKESEINFAVCRHFLPCATTRHTANLPFFAVCLSTWHRAKGPCLSCAKPLRHTANRLCHVPLDTALYFAVGLILHTAKCLPCARDVAHGKLALCRPLFAVSCLPCVTHGKQRTAKLGRHTGCLPCALFRAHGKGFAVCFIGPTAN